MKKVVNSNDKGLQKFNNVPIPVCNNAQNQLTTYIIPRTASRMTRTLAEGCEPIPRQPNASVFSILSRG